MKLTKRQEDMAQYIVQGYNQTEAYKLAYSTDKMLPDTITESASRVANSFKIATRVTQLRDYIASRVVEKAYDEEINTIKERKLLLTEIQNDKLNNPKHRIQAVDVHNKMDKVYADTPQLHQDNRTINVIVSGEGKELIEGITKRLIGGDDE